ncbi:MAG: sulfotransferase family protein [Actinomycetota bacterium]
MDLTVKAKIFRNWSPIRLFWEKGQPFVDWCYLGRERFVQPFFDDTISRRFREPFNTLFRHQTPLEVLGKLSAQRSAIAPTGFIFHLSRCGSTLVSQMLAALAQNIVISEASPISKILEANFINPQITDQQRIIWLRWMIEAFAQQRNIDERYFFVKFDSWNTINLSLIERAFPDVPWIFLYRNPLEVIVSQMRQRGAQMIPGSIVHILPGMTLTDALQMPPEEYCARVLARFCESALDNCQSPNALLVNYNQLPDAVTSEILEHFRARYEAADIEMMKRATQFDAKTPQMNFIPDTERKKSEASKAAHQAAEKWVNPLYERLENVRRQNIL